MFVSVCLSACLPRLRYAVRYVRMHAYGCIYDWMCLFMQLLHYLLSFRKYTPLYSVQVHLQAR